MGDRVTPTPPGTAAGRGPRYSVAVEDLTPERLLKVARRVVRESGSSKNFPRWGIVAAERVLVAVPSTFDRSVVDALVAAVGEVTDEPDLLVSAGHPLNLGGGEKEIEIFRDMHGPHAWIIRLCGFDEERVMRFCADGGYDVVAYAWGGPPCGSCRYEGIPWPSADYFASGMADFPVALQSAIDERTWETLLEARRVRIRDPEGTNVTWSLPEGACALSATRLGLDVAIRGHLNLLPWAVPLSGDASGVVAGTINHCGAIPHVRITVDGNRLERIEGGGPYGERWTELVDRYADVDYPGHPGPGWRWLFECALGTNPKTTRTVRFGELAFASAYERLRSGVLHFGFGAALMAPGTGASSDAFAADAAAYARFTEATDAPDGHFHVHNYFPTVDLETAAGARTTLVDAGRLTVLDDPAVREEAARHGDPDELLGEAWIPAVPGVNVPGDYHADYAGDPLAWIEGRSEIAGRGA